MRIPFAWIRADLADAESVAEVVRRCQALARTPRYSVDGTLHLAGAAGDGR
jgi:hypothetical protein